ncbi:MAG: peroxiredoxin [Chloroflexota bacterium]
MSLDKLPNNLPVPIDDGGANHLEGMMLPNVTLRATNGEMVTLDSIAGKLVIYVYPMTGRPDRALPENWEQIPGARGCTPQSCSFRDHYAELGELNTAVFGLSVQDTDYQNEAKSRLHLPFQLLSDETMQLKATLSLPTMVVAGMELYKRLTMIVENGCIVKVFYPVFPPDKNVDDVLAWLRTNATINN